MPAGSKNESFSETVYNWDGGKMNRRLPRFMNRILLLLSGLICLVLVIGLILVRTWQPASDYWRTVNGTILRHYSQWYNQLPGIYAGTSWIDLLPALIALLILILLIPWVKQQITRKAQEVGNETSQMTEGKTAITPNFVTAVFKQEFDAEKQISSIKVNGWKEKDENLLSVRINSLKGAHPGELKTKALTAVTRLDQILGKEVPILVHITSDWKNTFKNMKRVDEN